MAQDLVDHDEALMQLKFDQMTVYANKHRKIALIKSTGFGIFEN